MHHLEQISHEKLLDTGMVFKFIKAEDDTYIHTYCDGGLMYELGFSPEDIIGKDVFDIHPENDAQMKKEFYAKAWEGQHIQFEGVKESIHYIVYLNPVFEENRVIEVIGSCLNISPVKRLEEKVKQKENIYKTVLNTMSEAIFILEQDGKITNLNENADKILGIKNSCHLNEKRAAEIDLEVFDEDGSKINFAELPPVVTLRNGEVIQNQVVRIKSKNSRKMKWISVKSKPLDLHGVDSIAALVSFYDITNQKEQETQLKDSFDFQRTLNDKSRRGIVATDENGKIKLMNKYFHTLFNLNFNVNQYMGKDAKVLYSNFTNPQIIRLIEKSRENQVIVQEEFDIQNKSVILFCLPFGSDNESKGHLWIFEDVSERRQTERSITEARDEAEKANKTKSEFLSKMSHELRTPLNAILGFAQLLELEPVLTDDQKDFVLEILKGGRHLLDLINDILDLSRIETGNFNVNLTEVDCKLILNECLNIIEPIAKKKNITICRDIDQSKETVLIADSIRLRQVLLNLLDNAIKYNREKGNIQIFTKIEENHLSIHIADTGEGLTADELNRIFTPFYRAHDTSEEGAGIGLSLVKQLVNLMGGSVNVKSIKGKGSEFWISFPIQSHKHKRIVNSINTINSVIGTNKEFRILYIEDNESNIHLMENVLSGFTLYTATSGLEGLNIAVREKVDVILLDINLPDISGLKVFEVLKKMDKSCAVPVIALSARATKQDMKNALDKGFHHYLTKPINVNEVLLLMNNLMQK
jgi:ribose transport system substrate-binding protein